METVYDVSHLFHDVSLSYWFSAYSMILKPFFMISLASAMIPEIAKSCLAICATYAASRYIVNRVVDATAASQAIPECPICLEQFTTRCNQVCRSCHTNYHSSCLTEWLQHSEHCPICDAQMPPVPRRRPTAVEISRKYDGLEIRAALQAAQTEFAALAIADTLPLLEFVAPRVDGLDPEANLPASEGLPELPRLPLDNSQWREHCKLGRYVKVRFMRPKLSPDSEDLMWQQLDMVVATGFVVRADSDTCTINDFAGAMTELVYPRDAQISRFSVITPEGSAREELLAGRLEESRRWPVLEFFDRQLRPRISTYDEWLSIFTPGTYVRIVSIGLHRGMINVISEELGTVFANSRGTVTVSCLSGDKIFNFRKQSIQAEPFQIIFPSSSPPESNQPSSFCRDLEIAQAEFAQRPRELQRWFARPVDIDFCIAPRSARSNTPQSMHDQSDSCIVGQMVEVASYRRQSVDGLQAIVDLPRAPLLTSKDTSFGWALTERIQGVVLERRRQSCVLKADDGTMIEYSFHNTGDDPATDAFHVINAIYKSTEPTPAAIDMHALRRVLLAEPGMSFEAVDAIFGVSKEDALNTFSRIIDSNAGFILQLPVSTSRLLELFRDHREIAAKMTVEPAVLHRKLYPLTVDKWSSELTIGTRVHVISIEVVNGRYSLGSEKHGIIRNSGMSYGVWKYVDVEASSQYLHCKYALPPLSRMQQFNIVIPLHNTQWRWWTNDIQGITSLAVAQAEFADRPWELQAWFSLPQDISDRVTSLAWPFYEGQLKGIPATPTTATQQYDSCVVGERVRIITYLWGAVLIDEVLVAKKWNPFGWYRKESVIEGVVTSKDNEKCTVQTSEGITTFDFFRGEGGSKPFFFFQPFDPSQAHVDVMIERQSRELRRVIHSQRISERVRNRLLDGGMDGVYRTFSTLADLNAPVVIDLMMSRSRLLEIFSGIASSPIPDISRLSLD